MKKSVFPKIIYYLFTFALGILMALTLPYVIMYSIAPRELGNYLNSGEYEKAMELVGGYFNNTPIVSRQFEQGGIVLFEAITPVYNSGKEGDETKDETKYHKAYAGFIYGIKDIYNVGGEDGNLTKLIVTDIENKEHIVELLDYDSDNNDIKDNIGSLITDGFIYLDLDLEQLSSIFKLEFIDNQGKKFQTVDNLSLNYSEQFFVDVNEFLEEYNRDFKSEKLPDLDKAFREKSEHYKISSYGNVRKKADTKATIIVVVYFVVIYIIADFLVGGHYIIKFFKWIHGKVHKNKKDKKAIPKQEIFGHDYYSQVTMSLDLSELPDFSESVQVRYTNSDIEIAFTLLKENGYTVTERIKAGTYVNAWIDLNREYAPVDMPENLIVEGYKMDVKIKIIKRKEEDL